MTEKTLARSFAGGEITPEMYGRLDLAKYQTGLRTCRNAITLPHGPVTRRPGTTWVAPVAAQTGNVRLIPFALSGTESVLLEVGPLYIRFVRNGALQLSTNFTITAINSSGRVTTSGTHNFTATPTHAANRTVYISGCNIARLNNRWFRITRVSDTQVDLLDMATGAAVSVPETFTAGNIRRADFITTPFNSAAVPDIRYAQSENVMTMACRGVGIRELRVADPFANPLVFTLSNPDLSGLGGPGTISMEATIAQNVNVQPSNYAATQVNLNTGEESLPVTPALTVSNNLSLAGNFNVVGVFDQLVSNPSAPIVRTVRYYRQVGGRFGFIGQRTGNVNQSGSPLGLQLTDNNITPDLSINPPTVFLPTETELNAISPASSIPGAVAYHEQRRWFANTTAVPQGIWASNIGQVGTFTQKFPIADDDGFHFVIRSQKRDEIEHLVPLNDLLALTSSGDWRIFSDGVPAITPSSLSVKQQTHAGSSRVTPAITATSVLYVQAQGAKIREISYVGDGSLRYTSIDVTIMAPHLFDTRQVIDMTYSRAPDSIAWATQGTQVVGLTHVPDQLVYGWHRHELGNVASLAAVNEGAEEFLYLISTRNGQRNIERLASRFWPDGARAYYVDCGRRLAGPLSAGATIDQLWHLEGLTVKVKIDGATAPDQVVANGSIVLPRAVATEVHIGLNYVTDVQTLPLAIEAAAAGQGTYKNVAAAHVRFDKTSIFKVGPTFDRLVQRRARQILDTENQPIPLRNDEDKVPLAGLWDTDGSVCIRQDEPFPLTVVNITTEFQLGS